MKNMIYCIENDFVNGCYGEIKECFEKIQGKINLTKLVELILEKSKCTDLIKNDIHDDYGNLSNRTMDNLFLSSNIIIESNCIELTIKQSVDIIDYEDSGTEPMMIGGIFAIKINASLISIEILSEAGYSKIENSNELLLFLKEIFSEALRTKKAL